MPSFTVIIPDELPEVIEFIQEEMHGVAYINRALKNFQHKEVFVWHCSIMIDLQDLVENGMPSMDERKIIDSFGDRLDKLFKGDDPKKPNALFLARITWNATRELIWRVYDAEPVNKALQEIISNNASSRSFDYRIDPDKEWKLAEWHLSNKNIQ